MILLLNYWVLGDIRRYLLYSIITEGYFFVVTPNTIMIRQQSAPSTWKPSWRLWCGWCRQMMPGTGYSASYTVLSTCDRRQKGSGTESWKGIVVTDGVQITAWRISCQWMII